MSTVQQVTAEEQEKAKTLGKQLLLAAEQKSKGNTQIAVALNERIRRNGFTPRVLARAFGMVANQRDVLFAEELEANSAAHRAIHEAAGNDATQIPADQLAEIHRLDAEYRALRDNIDAGVFVAKVRDVLPVTTYPIVRGLLNDDEKAALHMESPIAVPVG
jgi:hypothetical protein